MSKVLDLRLVERGDTVFTNISDNKKVLFDTGADISVWKGEAYLVKALYPNAEKTGHKVRVTSSVATKKDIDLWRIPDFCVRSDVPSDVLTFSYLYFVILPDNKREFDWIISNKLFKKCDITIINNMKTYAGSLLRFTMDKDFFHVDIHVDKNNKIKTDVEEQIS